MVNQKGQAFSVFELLIAGVVAFAILIILLLILNGVIPPGGGDAKTAISNGISGIKPSGDTTTPVFDLSAKSTITSADLVTKTGLDEKSIVFAVGQFGVGSNPNTAVTATNNGTGIQYNGTSSLRAQARIICKATGEKLKQFLDETISSDSYKIEVDPSSSDACGVEEAQPCCIVLLQRATS
ncbi:MAG: hypothetical protein WCW13_02435 [archaeon]